MVRIGKNLEIGRQIAVRTSDLSQLAQFSESILDNLGHPLAILLAQIVTIILVARMFGWVCRKVGQPTVVGEIAAGIALGPSLLGMYFPQFSEALFPLQSLGNLQFLSQIGLILFMFVIGMELDLKVLKKKADEAVIISHASIILPFALGLGLAYFIYAQFAPQGVPFLAFGLFLGIAMSITAFPVLARIIQERGIHKTRLGTVVITCAAADDITAWCLLAAVIAVVKAGSFGSAIYMMVVSAAYVWMMLKVVSPFLKRIGELNAKKDNLSRPVVGIFFLILLVSSYLTEIIGIHALFGAFMAGAIMPDQPKIRHLFISKIEDVALVLLLPLFFVFTGLRTEIGLLNEPSLWKTAALVILTAVVGKFAGSALAARIVGQSWKDSLTIGALMNTRGLMELVVLNIGFDLGVLTPEIFAIMVIMALVTTTMTGPALDLIGWLFKSSNPEAAGEGSINPHYKILVPFDSKDQAPSLLRLASAFIHKLNGNANLTMLHISPSSELHAYAVNDYEQDAFSAAIEESRRLNQKVTTLFKVSNDVENEVAEVSNKGKYDLLLVGLEQSIFEGSVLGMVLGFTTRMINPDRLINKFTGKEKLFDTDLFDESTLALLAKSDSSVGIFIDKSFNQANKVVVPLFSDADSFLIAYAQKLIRNAGAQVSFLDPNGTLRNHTEIKEIIRLMEQNAPNHIAFLTDRKFEKEFLSNQDLLIISLESWKKLVETRSVWLNHTPSTLIIRP